MVFIEVIQGKVWAMRLNIFYNIREKGEASTDINKCKFPVAIISQLLSPVNHCEV
jgi:hypothetical protein